MVDFRLLGPVEVQANGRPVGLGPRQQRLVVAVLALEVNRLVPVDQLVDLIWPVFPPRTAVHAVQVCVSRLRRVLAGVGSSDETPVELVGQGSGYLLRADPMCVDAHRFRALVKQAKTAGDEVLKVRLFEEALGLWAGRALTGVAQEQIRDRLCRGLEEARLVAIEDLLEVKLRLGGNRDLLDELSGLVATHPVRERLVEQLMLALHRSGRRGAALELYRQTQQLLADELGLDPGGTLQQLELAILRADPDLDAAQPRRTDTDAIVASVRGAPVPAQLPPAVAGFAGRATELAELDDALTSARSTSTTVLITAIGGTAGVGKTALAVYWAHRVAHAFPDGQLYVNLRAFGPSGSPMAPGEAVRAFLDGLGVRPERIPVSLEAQVGTYRSLLAGRRVLVVLDNAATVEQIRPLLPGSPHCVVVVTSRIQLTGLVAAQGARSLTLDVLTVADAHDLLTRRLGKARVEAEPQAVDEIIMWCARLPLALAVVAAQAAIHPQFGLAGLADELRQARGRLDPFGGADPATDVRAVFSWSYRALNSDAARLFRLVGLHPGADIAAPAAASLAGVREGQILPQLAELVRAQLLTEHRPGRYACHDLLRAYATELVHAHDTESQRRAARHRMLDHYLHSAYAADRALNPNTDSVTLAPRQPGVTPEGFTEHGSAMAWFATEHAVLMAATEQAAQTGFDTHAWQLARTLATFLDLQGHWHELAAIHHGALDAARRLADLGAQAYAHRVLGRAYTQLGRGDDAFAHHQHSLDLFGQLGDRDGQAHTRMDLGWMLGRHGRRAEAVDQIQQALDLFRALDNGFAEAVALNALGFCHALLGDYHKTLAHCGQALIRFQEFGERLGQADTWDSLGYAHHHLGDHVQATRCYELALDAYREAGDRYHEADTLTHLGDNHHAAGEEDKVRAAWQQALAILEELDHPEAEPLRAKLRDLRGDAAMTGI